MEILKRLLEPIDVDQIKPPADQNLQELPFGEISWENFEKLIHKLVLKEAKVLDARPYGVPGDAQDGIDIFANLENCTYKVYQCKRENEFSPAKIAKAVTLFLNKDWADRATTFALCTHESLQSKVRSDEIIKQKKILGQKDIELEVWDSVYLNNELKQYPQLVYDFFGLSWAVGFCGPEVASSLNLKYPLPERNSYHEPALYLERTVVECGDDHLAFLFEKKITLLEAVKSHKRIALLAWGLNGKSTELENLAYLLSQTGTDHVYFLKLENYVDEDIASLIPDINHIPQSNLVVLLDGLDEVLPEKFEIIRRKISRFIENFPLTTIVVSCRTNFYTSFGEETGADTLKDFKPYRLQNLESDVVEKYLNDFLGDKKKLFVQEILKKELNGLLNIPYYLLKLSIEYDASGYIANSKAELFLEDLNELISIEIIKRFAKGHQLKEKKLKTLVQKLAFVMESMGTNQITTEELEKIIPQRDDFDLVKDSASIFYGNEAKEKTWKFYHHNLQEFLAADAISKRPFSEVKILVAMEPDYHIVKPLWVNSILFLMDILPENNSLKIEITDWLVKYNKELVVKLEPERLKPELRINLFKSIYNAYKAEGRRINNSLYRNDDLARFSESKEIAILLISDLKDLNDISALSNALSIAAYFKFSHFPDQLDELNTAVMKLIKADLKDVNYLVINVCYTHCELSSETFQGIFIQHQNTIDEDVRVGLLEGILLFDTSERYLDYILNQTISLIREKQDSYRNGNIRTHLSSGGKQISSYLEKIRSKKGLITIFKALEHYLLSLTHSGAFSKTLEILLKHAVIYPQEKELTDVIICIFKANHSYILHDLRLSECFIHYFNETDQLRTMTIGFIDELNSHDASSINTIAILADRDDIDYLRSKLNEITANDQIAGSFDYFMEKNTNQNLDYFRSVFAIPGKIIPPIRDYAEIESEKLKRDVGALFSKDKMMGEMRLIFSGFGMDDISYGDIRYDETENYWSDKYCSIARDFLELRPSGGNRILKEVLEQIEESWAIGFYKRIYNYWVANPKAFLDDNQTQQVENWCNIQLGLKKFTTGIRQHDAYQSDLDWDLITVCYFIRKLNILTYEKDVYLDMLSFIKSVDSEIDIFDFVQRIPHLNAAEIRAKVIFNLNNGIHNYVCLENHLKYIEENKIYQAAELLLAYLERPNTLEKPRILKLYLYLNGEVAKLENLLQDAKDFEQFLIIELVKVKAPYIQGYLKKQFKSEAAEEKKLFLAKQLIGYQDKKAFDYYFESITKTKRVPDDSSPYNPLYAITDITFTSRILELIKLAHNPEIIRESFRDLRSIGFTCLRNIFLFEDNHKYILRKLKLWMIKQRLRDFFYIDKPKLNIGNEIKLYLEGIQQQFNVSKSKVFDINQALKLYDNFKES